jgi:hypothetical protein
MIVDQQDGRATVAVEVLKVLVVGVLVVVRHGSDSAPIRAE